MFSSLHHWCLQEHQCLFAFNYVYLFILNKHNDKTSSHSWRFQSFWRIYFDSKWHVNNWNKRPLFFYSPNGPVKRSRVQVSSKLVNCWAFRNIVPVRKDTEKELISKHNIWCRVGARCVSLQSFPVFYCSRRRASSQTLSTMRNIKGEVSEEELTAPRRFALSVIFNWKQLLLCFPLGCKSFESKSMLTSLWYGCENSQYPLFHHIFHLMALWESTNSLLIT